MRGARKFGKPLCVREIFLARQVRCFVRRTLIIKNYGGMKMNGFTDKPASTLNEDAFGVQQYITGLKKFILECHTPMTIAVQGDWGSGKTSMMNMVRQELGGSVVTTWFNTWQYSQFNMGDSLAISLLSRLIDVLGTGQDKQNETFRKLKDSVFSITKRVTKAAAQVYFGDNGGQAVESFFQNMKDTEKSEMDIAQAINELRKLFQEAVNNKLRQSGKNRLVIFVDDLDRLHPGKAVELLEVLKLFLDCDNCVFVLAIDYAVVSQGVKEKYGKLLGEEKGRSFFDKIIQVPFKMPVANYDISNYVKNCFKETGIAFKVEEINTYVDLIRRSIGTNPRSMKRLFNTYLLLTIVVSDEVLKSDRNKQLLFAVLCLQQAFEGTYNYIVKDREEINADKLVILRSGTVQDIQERCGDIEFKKDEFKRLQPFMEAFYKVIDLDGDNQITESELSNLRNVLGISTISSSGDDTESISKRIKGIRVEDVREIDLRDHAPEEVEELIKKIEGLGTGIKTLILQNKGYGHILFKNARDNTFANIYMRKKGFAIDCTACSKSEFQKQPLASIVEKYADNITLYQNLSLATFRLKDKSLEEGFLQFAKACLDSWSPAPISD